MRHMNIIALIISVILGFQAVAMGQSQECKDPTARREVKSLEENQKLGVDYRDVVRFKLASRKTTYRVGELLSIDAAMLNVAGFPVFFHELSAPAFTMQFQYEKGSLFDINPYTEMLEGIVPQSYELVEPNQIIGADFYVLAGCKVQGIAEFNKAQQKLMKEIPPGKGAKEYDKEIFERNLFVTWGDRCIDFERPGTYTIIAEVRNDHVVQSPCEPNAKTAVGTIRSTPLTITIIE